MEKRNVTILLLLGLDRSHTGSTLSNSDNQLQAAPSNSIDLVSQFQASVGVPSSETAPAQYQFVPAKSPAVGLPRPDLISSNSPRASGSPAPVADHIRTFQTSFQLQGAEPLTALPPVVSRTSINSLINSDDSTPTKAEAEKKKRASPAKTEPAPKKVKIETAAKKVTKVETKKPKEKKKPAESFQPAQPKPLINPTMTTTKQSSSSGPTSVPSASIMEAEKLDEKDQPLPIIALNIPLLDPKDPKPGQSEVVVNVLKLAEDKYGWNAIHPNSKSAIELMNDMLDDDDEGDDDEEEDLQIVDDKGNPVKGAKPKEDEEVAKKKKITAMNRKIGKYDYKDPFIDDEELQWEEEIATTKEGFFVYWGPLVEDRNSGATTSKKSTAKAKK